MKSVHMMSILFCSIVVYLTDWTRSSGILVTVRELRNASHHFVRIRKHYTMLQMGQIPVAQLREIPFLDVENLNGRTLSCLSFYDGEKWHCWFPIAARLVKLESIPVEAVYFGRAAESSSDICLEFLNVLSQRASFPEIAPQTNSILDDVHNLGASFEKLHMLYKASIDDGPRMSRLVTTEIEYLFSTCRSLFDLLQEIIAILWDKVELRDKDRGKNHLPTTFSKMVIADNQTMTADEIRDKRKVPQELAEFYARSAVFFSKLRKNRDRIIHGGKASDLIFSTERGFAVSKTLQPYASFQVWNEDHLLPNDLASLRPVLAHVVVETLDCCEDFANTIQRIIGLQKDVAPGFRLFLRGYHNDELLRLREIRDDVLWWDE